MTAASTPPGMSVSLLRASVPEPAISAFQAVFLEFFTRLIK